MTSIHICIVYAMLDIASMPRYTPKTGVQWVCASSRCATRRSAEKGDSEMREIPELPRDFTYRTIVLLNENCNNGIGVCYNIETLEELAERLQYGSAFCYGDILAIADRHEHCTGLSHWHSVSGSNEMRPVWRWESTYTILERYRVGRKGKFISSCPFDAGSERVYAYAYAYACGYYD